MFHYAGLVINNARRRQLNLIRNAATSNESSKIKFRLNEVQLNLLCASYHNYRIISNPDSNFEVSEKRVKVFLNYLSGGGYYRQTGFPFGLAKSTTFLYTREVVSYMMSIASMYITLPDVDEFNQLSKDIILVNSARKSVILYVDGFIVPIQRPDGAGDAYFCDVE